MITWDLIKELMHNLMKEELYCDDFNVISSNIFSAHITWGDWKHEHLRLDYLVREFLNEKGLDLLMSNTKVTEEDGSDTYSAEHYYAVTKLEEK